MKTRIMIRIVAAMAVAGALNGAAGQLELPYVGQLYNGSTPVNQTQYFNFVLYSAPSGGVQLWSSGEVTQYVARGFVSVNLGGAGMAALPESIFDGRELFLEIQVGVTPGFYAKLSPRTNLTSSAYVHNAPRLGGLPAVAYQRKWTNVVVVGIGGEAEGCDTNTLEAGIALAGAKANATDRYTVLLLPGVYNGDAASSNYVDIVGVNRDSCVITGGVTITHDILVENVRLDVGSHVMQAIDIQGGRPTVRNVQIFTENNGVSIGPSAGRAQLINLDVQCGGGTAVEDGRGVLIDGLRVNGVEGVRVMNLSPVGITIDYKNITHQGGGIVLQVGVSSMGVVVDGDVRHVTADGGIELNRAGALRLRDLVVEVNIGGNAALQINSIGTQVTIEDARLRGPIGVQYGSMLGMPLPPITGQTVLDDAEITGLSGAAILAFVPASTVTVQHCELVSDSGRGIEISTNQFGATTPALYVQTSLIDAAQEGINLDGATELWLYDTTIKCGLASVQGNTVPGPGMTPPPRIADCRLETDTSPTQGSGGPGWNAFGGKGNAGGTGEDTRGNLVAPNPGTPVAP